MNPPVFRFAPSPNGRLHLGHAFSALLNQQLAKQAGGRLLLRLEDIDTIRCTPEFEAGIFDDLRWLGIHWEEPVRRQSEHFADYEQSLRRLTEEGLVYPAFMSRGEMRAHIVEQEAAGKDWPRDPDGVPLYPGLDKALSGKKRAALIDAGKPFAWRLDMAAALARIGRPLAWAELVIGNSNSEAPPHRPFGPPLPLPGGEDTPAARLAPIAKAAILSPGQGERWRAKRSEGRERGLGKPWDDARSPSRQIEARPQDWGDVILARRDTPTSYHLSVVVDDALQGTTHVVRGQDLFAATAVHRVLQELLGLAAPVYHHHRLILGPDGRKLSKSLRDTGIAALRGNGAAPDDIRRMTGLDPL